MVLQRCGSCVLNEAVFLLAAARSFVGQVVKCVECRGRRFALES